jgi:hypothetical protein
MLAGVVTRVDVILVFNPRIDDCQALSLKIGKPFGNNLTIVPILPIIRDMRACVCADSIAAEPEIQSAVRL